MTTGIIRFLFVLILSLSIARAGDPPAATQTPGREPYQRAPTAIMVVPRASYDMPESIRKELDHIGDTVVTALATRMPGVDVLRRTKELPLGIEGSAGALIEMLVTCEYASYEEASSSGMATPMFQSVPTRLQVHVRGRRGLAGAVAMDLQVESSKDSPAQINRFALRDLVQQHSQALVGAVIEKINQAIGGWDPADLGQRLAAVPVPTAQPPLIAVSCTTTEGKDPRKPSAMAMMPTGARDMYGDMVYLLARRLGPVRLTTDPKAVTDATISIANTVWYQTYGTTQGMMQTNNGSLPYRCEMQITLTSAVPHRWSGNHTYSAAVELPDQVTRSGGFASEAIRVVSNLTSQIGEQLESELAYERAYRKPAEGEFDEYVIRLKPVGGCASPSVQATRWYKNLPAKLTKVLTKSVEPARIVTEDQATAGRVAGVLLVTVDGRLSNATYPDGTKAIEPSELSLTAILRSCYSGSQHNWEGEHPATVTFDHQQRFAIRARQPNADPNDAMMMKLLTTAFR